VPQPLLIGSFYTSGQRAVLNGLPYVWLLIVVPVVSIALALGVLWLARRYGRRWRSSADSAIVAGVAAMVLTLFALLLAFAIVNLYAQHADAHADVVHEADDLALVLRDARIVGMPDVEPAVDKYVCEVESAEFPRMRNGNGPARSSYDLVDKMFTAVHGYKPVSRSDEAFYQSIVDHLNDAVAQRRDRIESINAVLPSAFAGLLLVTAAISVFLVCFIRTASAKDEAKAGPVEALLVSCVAFVVAAGLLTALLFEFPFSGPLKLSNHPLQAIHGCKAADLTRA
jgi:multisubunit Na+/H+ antiporter MnhB subunit